MNREPKHPWWTFLSPDEFAVYRQAVKDSTTSARCPHCIMTALTNRALQRSKVAGRRKPVDDIERKAG